MDAVSAPKELLHRQFPGDRRDDDFAIGRLQRPIHYQQIAGANADALHGVANGANEESGGGFLDQVRIQIQRGFDVIFRRRGEPRRYGADVMRERQRCEGEGQRDNVHIF